MATSAKYTLKQVDAALVAATKRVRGLNRLITAIVALLASAIVLCSIVTGIADHQAGVQIPFGPHFTISASADSGDTKPQQEGVNPSAPLQAILSMPPPSMQKGTCFIGEFGMIEIYPPGPNARTYGRSREYP